MTTMTEQRPDVHVQTEEYIRLLGFPRGWELRDRSLELADWAREWYAQYGRPWAYIQEAASIETSAGTVHIDGVGFTSARLAKTLRDAAAHSAMLVAVSAGPELEAEAQRRWQDGKPDEYFFLEVFGSAVVEHLVTMTGARLCASAESQQMAVLPHDSPGYPEWTIEEQGKLLALMRNEVTGRTERRSADRSGPRTTHRSALREDLSRAIGPLEVLDSGMLRPKKSLLAVFGVTRHVDRVKPLTNLVPCENCSYGGCQFRRVPYKRARAHANPELAAIATTAPDASAAPPPPRYSVNVKALQRWTRERLSLIRQADGHIDAAFRYDGTTCTNMGRPLAFRYDVRLGSRERGYPILRQSCSPVEGDTGHTSMCRYISEPDQLMAAIAQEAPLAGRPLDEVLAWRRPDCAAGCYCDGDARQHKWGLVLETIHFALIGAQKP